MTFITSTNPKSTAYFPPLANFLFLSEVVAGSRIRIMYKYVLKALWIISYSDLVSMTRFSR